MKKINFNNLYKDFTPIIIGVNAFLFLSPFFVWNNSIIRQIFFVLGFILLINKISIKYLQPAIFYFLLIIYVSFTGLQSNNKLSYLPLISFLFLMVSNELKSLSYKYFVILFSISLVPSILILPLVNLGIPINYTVVSVANELLENIQYRNYFGAIISINWILSFVKIFRLQGMLNEPGLVGTVSALILTLNSFNLKKWYNKIILIGGVLSFSLAFFTIIIIYFILSFRAQIKKNIFVFISIAVIVFNLYSIAEFYIIERVLSEDSILDLDNRTNIVFDKAYNAFLTSGKNVVFGKGALAHINDQINNASSYKVLVYNYGFFGLGLIILFFIYYFYFNKRLSFNKNSINNSDLIFLIVFLASIYQRPGVLNLDYIVIFVGGLAYLRSYRKEISLK